MASKPTTTKPKPRTRKAGKFDTEKPDKVMAIAELPVITEPEIFRREAFAQAYVALGTGAAAARKAGYTGSTRVIAIQANRLMHEPAVRERIAQIQRDLIAETGLTQRMVLAELSRIAFMDIRKIVDENGELLPLNTIDEDTARAMTCYKVTQKTFGEDGESVEKEVKFASKESALEKIGKHLGLWKQEGGGGEQFTPEAFVKALLEARERVNSGIQINQQPAQAVLGHRSSSGS